MSEPVKINLKNILKSEERQGKLTVVDNDFYHMAHMHIQELETELKNADIGNFKYYSLEDDYNSAKVDYEKILELRMMKINREALIAKSLRKKDNPEPENLIPEEKDLYNALLSKMSNWRKQRLYPLINKSPEPTNLDQGMVKKPEVRKININDYVMVRALVNIPTFVGMDERNYTLMKEDVVTVPAFNAKALIARKAVIEIQKGP